MICGVRSAASWQRISPSATAACWSGSACERLEGTACGLPRRCSKSRIPFDGWMVGGGGGGTFLWIFRAAGGVYTGLHNNHNNHII
jgi:hypothetical protein